MNRKKCDILVPCRTPPADHGAPSSRGDRDEHGAILRAGVRA